LSRAYFSPLLRTAAGSNVFLLKDVRCLEIAGAG
jgi:hypothetical protein